MQRDAKRRHLSLQDLAKLASPMGQGGGLSSNSSGNNLYGSGNNLYGPGGSQTRTNQVAGK